MRRMAGLGMVVVGWLSWTTACTPEGGGFDVGSTTATDSGPETDPGATSLEGTWDGELACPDGATATLGILLLPEGATSLAGPAFLVSGSGKQAVTVEFTVSVAYLPYNEEVRDLAFAVGDCIDADGEPVACETFENVVWDRSVTPAVIAGELADRAGSGAPCTFVLRAFHDEGAL